MSCFYNLEVRISAAVESDKEAQLHSQQVECNLHHYVGYILFRCVSKYEGKIVTSADSRVEYADPLQHITGAFLSTPSSMHITLCLFSADVVVK